MAYSQAIPALGTLLKRGNGASPEVFTTLAEVRDITGPTLAATTKDVSYQNQGDRGRQFITTLVDGKISVTLNSIPSDSTQNGTAGLIADMRVGTRHNYQLVFPDQGSTTWPFAALVTKFEIVSKVADELLAQVDFQITGTLLNIP